MAAYKRSHNKKHMCVSCGGAYGKFQCHVQKCSGSTMSGSDLLVREKERVETLGLTSFSAQELECEYGSDWPRFAYAFVNLGIPIKVGKKAVSSTDQLEEYIRNENLGRLFRTDKGFLSFTKTDARPSHMPTDVPHNPIPSTSHHHAVGLGTNVEVHEHVLDLSIVSSQDLITEDACRLQALHKSRTSCDTVVSPVTVENDDPSVEESRNTCDTVVSPVTVENDDPSVEISDVSHQEDESPIKITLKHKRVITSPSRPSVRMPDESIPLVTRSKAGKVRIIKYCEEPVNDQQLNVDDDVHDPSFKPIKTHGIAGLRSKRKAKMSKQLISGQSESDTSSSDSDSDSDSALRKDPTTQRRNIAKKMKNVGLTLSNQAYSDAELTNLYLAKYTLSMRTKNRSRKHVQSKGTRMLKVMQFFSEDKNFVNYNPQRLLNMERRKSFYDALEEVGLAAETVTKYCEALTSMIKCDSNNLRNAPELRELFKVASDECVAEVTGRKSLYTSSVKQKRQAMENCPVDKDKIMATNMENHTHLKKKAEQILNSTGVLPDSTDLRLVNMFFYSHFLIYGHRPCVFQQMKVDEIRQAAKRYDSQMEIGNVPEYRHLATDDHKTGDSYTARVPFKDDIWGLLVRYKKKLRPRPDGEENKKFLFLNSKGKKIVSASADYSDVCKIEKLHHVSSTVVRHAIETKSNSELTEKEQGNVAEGVLTHSLKTARKVYNDDTRHQFYDGVKNIDAMYRNATGNPTKSRGVSQPSETVSHVSDSMPEASLHISSGHQDELKGTVRSESPAVSVSSSNSDTIHVTKAENRKSFINAFWPNIGPESKTPSSAEYSRFVSDNPCYGLDKSDNERKKIQDAFLLLVCKKRATEIVDLVGHQKVSDPESKFTALLKERKWMNKKLLRSCIKLYEQNVPVKRKVNQDSKTIITDHEVLRSIEKQEWPALKTYHPENKGTWGIKAKVDIKIGTVVCDYHGELLSCAEGDRRYNERGDTDNNVYMFKFASNGELFYIDANEDNCLCHPGKLLKGRLINHSSKPNVKPLARYIQDGIPVLIFLAMVNIKQFDEITFDYNSKSDRQSSKLDWM